MGDLASIGDKLKRSPNGYKKLAPDYLQWQKEKLFLMSLITGSKKLQECAPESVVHSALQLAGMGLTLNPARQHAYLIPRKARKKDQNESWDDYNRHVGTICYPSPGYRGLTWLAEKSGKCNYVRADVVYKKDAFSYRGSFALPEYVSGPIESRTYQNAVGVFAVVELKTGGHLCELIERDNVLRIRAMSEQPNGILWNEDKMWTEGWKKSAIRRLLKTTPVDDLRLENAQLAMDHYEGVSLEPAIPELEHINLDCQMVLSEKLDEADVSRETFLEAYNAKSVQEFPAPLFQGAMARLDTIIQQKESQDANS